MSSPLPILFHGDNLVAVDKPTGIAVIPGRGESTSILELLAAQLKLKCSGTVDPRVRVIHRLDKGTSGVVLYALSSAAQRYVSQQFLDHTVQKEYLALVAGAPEADHGCIESPIAPHPHSSHRMIVTKHGRDAITEWKVESRFGQWTLLRCFPKTGKTHQIRVHLKSIGLPLAIDPLYNASNDRHEPALFLSDFKRGYRPHAGGSERPLVARLTLHAARLNFMLPTGIRQTLESPVPRDLRATFAQMSKHARHSR